MKLTSRDPAAPARNSTSGERCRPRRQAPGRQRTITGSAAIGSLNVSCGAVAHGLAIAVTVAGSWPRQRSPADAAGTDSGTVIAMSDGLPLRR